MGKLNGVNFHGTGLYIRELEHRVSLCFFMLNSLGAFRRILFYHSFQAFLTSACLFFIHSQVGRAC